MRDPWEAILTSLEPDYQKLKDMTVKDIPVYADLSQRGRYWCIHLQEKFGLTDDAGNCYNTDEFDKKVNWSTSQLEKWPDVRRMAFDMWYFKRKRDALKFQTLFYLKWAE